MPYSSGTLAAHWSPEPGPPLPPPAGDGYGDYLALLAVAGVGRMLLVRFGPDDGVRDDVADPGERAFGQGHGATATALEGVAPFVVAQSQSRHPRPPPDGTGADARQAAERGEQLAAASAACPRWSPVARPCQICHGDPATVQGSPSRRASRWLSDPFSRFASWHGTTRLGGSTPSRPL
jgi:hypothetical protein